MWWLFFLILALAVRLVAARGDLWLDEIWSLNLARAADSPLAIWTGLHHDNNHYLNTLVMYALGDVQNTFWYRLPAVLAGAGTVVFAYKLGDRHSRKEGVIAATLFSLSYLLVYYSSEARGYAYAAFFAVAGFWALQNFLHRGGVGRAALVLGLCTLGFFSHLSFLYAFLGFLAYALCSRRQSFFVLLGPMAVLGLALWWWDLRFLQIGGDQPSSLGGVVLSTAGWLLFPGWEWLAAIAVVAGCAWAFWRGFSLAERAMFLAAVISGPLLILLVRQQEYLAPRYFLIPCVFVLLALARSLSELRPPLTFALLGAFVLTQGLAFAELTQTQRGQYSSTLARLCTEGPASVGADQDFRVRTVVEFYVPRVPGCEHLQMLPMQSWSATAPQWLIMQSLSPSAPTEITPSGVGRFTLQFEMPAPTLSGWGWAVYRRQP